MVENKVYEISELYCTKCKEEISNNGWYKILSREWPWDKLEVPIGSVFCVLCYKNIMNVQKGKK